MKKNILFYDCVKLPKCLTAFLILAKVELNNELDVKKKRKRH